MSMFQIFDISASGMSAQSVRLNTIASNLANADSISSSPESAYRSRTPVFSEVLDNSNTAGSSVKVKEIVESQADSPKVYAPDNPLADDDGYIYRSNVNVVEEMANMTSASRSYQSNVEAMSTIKRLMLATLRLGQGS